ncbi:Ff.00g135150.m01.CDS01 [Fusarium sp. VM40]|nr:Ff.00g135150.m01.CDS01 [Fusarium sp. VM40]
MTVEILSWLRNIHDDPDSLLQQTDLAKPPRAIQPRTRKRHRSHSSTNDDCLEHNQNPVKNPAVCFSTHPTPPPDSLVSSEVEMAPAKKRKTTTGAVASPSPDDIQEDNDATEQETPKPLRRVHLPSVASSTSSATSGRSGASSPRKQLAAMALSTRGVETRAMSDPSGLPPALAQLRTKLLQFGRGRGILGLNSLASIRDEAAARAFHPDMVAIYEDKDFSCSAHRDALGSTPSPEDVLYILECAADCLRMGRSEAAWNNEVHFPLLCLALRPRVKGAFQRLVNVTNCSTASIVPDYRIRFVPDKKIDFCVYLDPRYDTIDTNIASQVDSVRARLPLLSINPTDDLSLLSNPIAISIETKRPGEGLDTANLQVATFLTAHLTILQRLVDAGAAMPVDEGEKMPSVDDLGFLPGLIVQGNTWNFVAASRQDSRIIIWSETSLGLTGDISGIYQIIASLQLLREWINATYWPWLRRVIQRSAQAQLQGLPTG